MMWFAVALSARPVPHEGPQKIGTTCAVWATGPRWLLRLLVAPIWPLTCASNSAFDGKWCRVLSSGVLSASAAPANRAAAMTIRFIMCWPPRGVGNCPLLPPAAAALCRPGGREVNPPPTLVGTPRRPTHDEADRHRG